MTAPFIGRAGILTRPTSPIIIQTTSGAFSTVLSDVQSLALNRVFSGNVLGQAVGLARNKAQATVRSMPSFNMIAAVLSGPVIVNLLGSPNVKAVWEDVLTSVSQFPTVGAASTWAVNVPLSGSLTFTGTKAIKTAIGADTANAAGYSGQGMVAAIVDTGVAPLNPQLHHVIPQSAVPGDYLDLVGHGSWCSSALAGTIATDEIFSQMVGSTVQVEGMAPSTSLHTIKAMEFPGTAPTSELLQGLQIAYNLNPDVLSLSWGGAPTGSDPTLDVYYTPIQQFISNGTIVCAAIGNNGLSGPGQVDSPGCIPGVIGVAAYNAVTNTGWSNMFGQAGEVCGFSSYGPSPYGTPGPSTIMPGAVIDSGVSGAYINEMSISYSNIPHSFQAIAGTSMATPITAGLLVCCAQAHKKLLGKRLSNLEVIAMLQSTGNAQDPSVGYGPITWGLYRSWMQNTNGVTV